VAARAVTRPDLPLADVAAELREAGGLDAFRDSDPYLDVPAVLSWSLRGLDPDAERLFRLLGTHPGPDASVDDAAALTGAPVALARRLLAELAQAHLVAERQPGRYVLHALLRAFAAGGFS
jgi:hypothetical protein